MERILTVVEVGIQVGGESLISTIKIAILPIAKVFTVCSLGLLMASLAHGRKLLNGLVFSFLLPCLIFSQLGQAIIGEKILEWKHLLLVKSYYDKRIIGCPGVEGANYNFWIYMSAEDEHDAIWFWLDKVRKGFCCSLGQ